MLKTLLSVTSKTQLLNKMILNQNQSKLTFLSHPQNLGPRQ